MTPNHTTMKRILPAILLSALALWSCSDDDATRRPTQHEMELTLTDGHWTYLSLEQGSVVATVVIDDTASQAALAQRTDWDVALAPGGLVRTNSAASGPGNGGIRQVSTTYEATDPAAPLNLLTDTTLFYVY